MGVKNPSWWMRHGYQMTDMGNKALLAANATATVQDIWVPLTRLAEFHMDEDEAHVTCTFEDSVWALWARVNPAPAQMYAGLPGGFPWES